jgi:hypothetical protein
MTQFQADNNMWLNLVKKDITNLPLATLMRAGFLIKDMTRIMKNNKTDKEKYKRMKEKAIQRRLIDPEMSFK